jgi:hypothetical protein
MPNRRDFMVSAAGLLLTAAWTRRVPASAPPQSITIYKSKTCGCCAKWVEHLQANGFTTQVHDDESMDQVKDNLGVPSALRSCHTALAGRYLIEGHVPAGDIRKLLVERPAVAGLAVPGMPSGTPGMAQSEADAGNFVVLAFQLDGTSRPYAKH